MPLEKAWHRNLRRTRKIARGILTTAQLGIAIPLEITSAAKSALVEHHATDADTMLSWAAQRQMQNREMLNIMDMMKGTYLAMQNQKGMTPWGNGGKIGWKGNGKGGNKGGGKDGGKGMNPNNMQGPNVAIWNTPCGRCGGMHPRSQCPAYLNQTIYQKCYLPGHKASRCRNIAVDHSTICKCCGETGHTNKQCPKHTDPCDRCKV